MVADSWMIVGLGNPGPEYARTRHNVGWLVAAEIANRIGASFSRHRRSNADVAVGRIDDLRVSILKSRGYMNESGGPVAAAMAWEKLGPERLIAVHDDLDLEFGRLRVKRGGGDGGHNGLKSIRRAVGCGDFYRVRLGIGRPPGRQDPAEFVLRPFNAAQCRKVPALVGAAADATMMLLTDGLERTQNEVNCR